MHSSGTYSGLNFVYTLRQELSRFQLNGRSVSYIALSISPFFFLEYKDAFYMFDRDNNGYITTSELNSIMRTLGFNPTEEDLQQMIFTVDYDGKWKINNMRWQFFLNLWSVGGQLHRWHHHEWNKEVLCSCGSVLQCIALNVERISRTHSAAPRLTPFFPYHILTSFLI